MSAHRLVTRVVREQAADRTLAAAARDAVRGLQAMLPAPSDAWRHAALMHEYITQVTALADDLDAFPSLIAGPEEEHVLGLLGGT